MSLILEIQTKLKDYTEVMSDIKNMKDELSDPAKLKISVDEAEAKLQAAEQRARALKEQVFDTLNSMADTPKLSSVEFLQNAIDNGNAQLRDYQEALVQVRDKVRQVAADMDELYGNFPDFADIAEELNRLTKQRDALSERFNEETDGSKREQLQKKIDNISTEINNKERDITSKTGGSEFLSRFDTLNKQLDDYSEKITDIENRIGGVKYENSVLLQDIANIFAHVRQGMGNDVAIEIKELQNQLAETRKKAKEVSDSIETAQADGSGASQSQISELNAQLVALQGKETLLRSLLDTLKVANASTLDTRPFAQLSQEIDATISGIQSLHKAVETTDTKHMADAAIGSLTDLKKEVEDTKNRLEDISKQRREIEDSRQNETPDQKLENDSKIKKLDDEAAQLQDKLKGMQKQAAQTRDEINKAFVDLGQAMAQGSGSSAVDKLAHQARVATARVKELQQARDNLAKVAPSDDPQLKALDKQLVEAKAHAQQLNGALNGARIQQADQSSLSFLQKLKKNLSQTFSEATRSDEMKTALDSLPPSIRNVTQGFMGMTKAVMAFLASPVGMALGAIAAIVASVQEALSSTTADVNAVIGKDIQLGADGQYKVVDVEKDSRALDDLTEKQQRVNAVTAIWRGFLDEVQHQWHLIGDGIIYVIDKIASFSLSDALTPVTEAFTDAWNGITSLFDSVKTKISDVLSPVGNAILQVEAFAKGWEVVKDVAGKAGEAIMSVASTVGDLLGKAGSVAAKFITASNPLLALREAGKSANGDSETTSMSERIKLERDAADQETRLNARRLKEREKIEQIEKEIAEAQQEAYSSTNTQERIKAYDKMMSKQRELGDMQKSYAQEELEIQIKRNKAGDGSAEAVQKTIELNTKLNDIEEHVLNSQKMALRQRTNLLKAQRQAAQDEVMMRQGLDLQQQKTRLSMMKDVHQRELDQIKISEQEQLLSLKRQETQWRRANAGVLKAWQQAYIKTQKELIEAQTDYQIAEKEHSFQEARIKEMTSLNEQLTKDRLALEENTLTKTLSNIEIEKESRLRSIEEQRKSWLAVQKELTEEQKKYIDERTALATQAAEKARKDALTKTYAGIGAEEYNKFQNQLSDIRTLSDNGMDKEAMVAARQAEKAIREAGAKFVQDLPELEDWVEQLNGLSLSALREEFDKAKESYQALMTAKAEGQLVSEEELLTAAGQVEILNQKIQESGSTAGVVSKNLSTLSNGMKGIVSDMDEGVQKVVDTLIDATDKFSNLFDAISKMSNDSKKDFKDFAKTIASNLTKNAKAAETTAVTAIEGMRDVAHTNMSETVTTATTGIDAVGTMTETTTDAMAKTATAGAQAMQAVERASVILAIIQIALQVLQKISAFIKDDHARYEEANAKQQQLNAMTTAMNEYEQATLRAEQAEKRLFSATVFDDMSDAWEVASLAMKSYYDKANEQQVKYVNEAGGGFLNKLNPLSTQFWKQFSKEGTEMVSAMDNLRIETRASTKGFLGFGGKSQKTADLRSYVKEKLGLDLFDAEGMIDVEAAQIVIDRYGDKLVGETKATLEALVKQKEEYDNAITSIKEGVADMYSPLVDDMTNAVWTWLETSEDALTSFKDYAGDTFKSIAEQMLKTMTQKLIFQNFDTQLNDIATKYAKGELTEEDMLRASADVLDATMATAETTLPQIQEMAQRLNERMKESGIDMTGASDVSATGGGFQTMSEQTATELSGRFTALYQSGLRIEENQRTATADMRSILSLTSDSLQSIIIAFATNTGIADDIRNTIALSYLELQSIQENTANSAKTLKTLKDDVAEIRKVSATL